MSAATSLSAFRLGKSEAPISTTFSPLYPAAVSAFLAASKSRLLVSTSRPASLAIGRPGQKKPAGTCRSFGSSPVTACMKSVWSTTFSSTCRIAGLSKGGSSWFMRRQPISPVGSLIEVFRLPSVGTRSAGGCSHQSISPVCIAEAAVA